MEQIQLYICPVCRSIKLMFGEEESHEEFVKGLPDLIPCNVGDCHGNALFAEKICTAAGDDHEYVYYEDVQTNEIYCSKHVNKSERWKILKSENLVLNK